MMATILIVDDCPKNRQHFAKPLARYGHRLLEASDSANAMKLARSERPHLIIADARVPMKDGFEIVHGVRSDRNLVDTPMILYSDRDFQSEAIALTHAIDVPVVLPKPTKPEDIVSMVNLALNASALSAASGAGVRGATDRANPPKNWNLAAAELERLTVENQRLNVDLRKRVEELARYSQRLEAMSEIDHAILEARSSQEIAQAVVSGIRRLIPCQLRSVVEFDFTTEKAIVLAASMDGQSHWSTGTTIAIDALGDIQDLRMGQVRIVEDLLALSKQSPGAEATLVEAFGNHRSAASQNELIGMFKLGRMQAGVFDREDVQLAREIGDRVAVAIQNVHLFEQVRSGQQRLRALTGQLMKAQEDERRRISRELHDEIGQALTVTKLSLQTLDRTAENFSLATQNTMETIESVLQQVRNLSLDLRPPMLDDLGLVAALRSYLDRQGQSVEFVLCFDLEPIVNGMAAEIETACFRVVQEAMTNIIRHARPSRVYVEMRQHEADLQPLIRDDGIGFDVGASRQRAVRGESLGLLGMEERVKLLGGRIDIESAPHCGTELHIRFPSDATHSTTGLHNGGDA